MLDSIRQNAQSWGVKLLFAIIILVFVFWGIGSFQGDRTSVLVKVNDVPVLIKDYSVVYERSLEELRQQNPNITPEELQAMQFRQQVMWRIINRLLLQQEAAKLGVTVSPYELRQAVARVPAFQNEQGRFDPELYKQVVHAQRSTLGQFEDGFKEDLVMAKLREYVTLPASVTDAEARDLFSYLRDQRVIDYILFERADYLKKIKPTKQEIQAFYNENTALFKVPPRIRIEYLLFTPQALGKAVEVRDEEVKAFYDAYADRYFLEEERVKTEHILVKAEAAASPEEDEKARVKATGLYQRLKKGESFSKLAKAHSEGPSAPQGGELGWITRGQTVPPFEEVAFALKAGEISEPVRTDFGWHVIRVVERQDARQVPFEEAREQALTMVVEEKAGEKVTGMLDDALDQALMGVALEDVAKDLGIELRDSGLFSQDQAPTGLTPKDLETLFSTPTATLIDKPLPVEGGYMVARVAEVQPESVSPLAVVKEQVVSQIKEVGAGELARKDAEALIAKLKKGGKLSKKQSARLTETKPFGRQGYISGLGMNQGLVAAAFASDKVGQWLPVAYQVSSGYAVAKLKESISQDEATWDKEKILWSGSISQGKKQDLFQAFVMGIQGKAVVEIVSPEVLNR
jgi:peptidyl-prolyl cis-trans isomerase D